MAGDVRGITVEFAGDTTKLQKALREVNKGAKDIDKELKQVNKSLKFNPTSVELWRQKQDLLRQKIDQTKTKLDVLKQAQAQMDASGVDKSSAEYRKLQRDIIETESKLKTFNAQLKQVGNVQLRAVSEQFKQVGNSLTSAGQAMQGISMAAGVATAAIGAAAVKSGMWADDLNTLSKVTGIGTDKLQAYSATADLVDVSVETIAKSSKKLTKSMSSAQSGTGEAAEAFDQLGVSVVDSNGNLRDNDEVFQETIAALGQMENETERDALAQKIFGKSAAELNPLIEDQGETLKMVNDALKKYDLDFVDQETLDKANQFNDQLDMMKLLGQTALSIVGAQLAGYLAPALEKVVDLVGRFASWISQLDPRILTVIAVIGALVAAIAPMLMFFGKIAFAISAITGLMGTLGVSFLAIAGPVLIVIGVIAALIAIGVALYKNWDEIKAAAKQFKADFIATFAAMKASLVATWAAIKAAISNAVNSIKTSVTTTWNNIKTAVTTAVNNIKTSITTTFNSLRNSVAATWNSIKTAITQPIQNALSTLRGIVNKIKGLFPISIGKIFSNLKLPKIDVSAGKAPWGIGGKGTPPSFSVDWYAKGGIFNGPTVIGVGEAGPEAVVPLNKLWQKLDAIADTGGEQITINVYANEGMDVKQLAAEVERRLVDDARRRRAAWGY